MAHVSQQKKDVVAEFVELIDKYEYIGAVNMENLPARQLHNMREQLRGSVLLRMSKRRLLAVALRESKKEGVDKLIDYLKGMPALLFTNESPFKLYKTLKKNKSKTGIKGGQKAPSDILVPAGPTSFAPGPVIGELGSVGIKAGIDGGKVAIKADAVVAKEGDVVSSKLASLLTRLGIEPMEIGLDLSAVFENGEILTKSILDVDEDQYIQDITNCASWAFNLGVNAAIPNSETIEVLVQNAFSESRNLAINEFILTDLTVNDTIARVHNQMLSVAGLLSEDALSEELNVMLSAKASVVSAPIIVETVAEEKKDNDKNKEEPSAAAGLGALFG